ncbi:MAG: hypothetical protein LUE19_10685, partial [Clostridiales bacterium]|nr:hypothetical protein [Clostridiales bacterium]
AYNLCLAAASAGLDTDYSLVWNMGHGSNEGTSTGTFIEWVEEIVPTEAVSEGPVTVSIDAATYLDYSAGIEAGVYTWVASDDGSYYFLAATDEEGNPIYTESSRGGKTYQGVYTSTEITNTSYQTMLVYIPAAYLIIDEDGNVTGIDHDAVIGDYTADTAPIIYQNNCAGWNSSSPGSCSTDYIDEGMIYVSAGARSRNATDESGDYITGKSPTQVVDLKAGVIELRANTDIFPGNTDAIISVGTSGAGQMSSILGASGNMSEYYPYMYETGVLGVTYDAETDTYASEYADNIYAAQCYCPIADLENADLAYAWWWYDSAENGGDTYTEMGASEPGTLSEFKLRLQELEAWAYVDYINSLGLTDEDGNALTLTTPREGSYYDAILQNMSDALNALVEAGDIDPATEYEDSEDWLVQNEDGTWSVTDMAGFMSGTGLVNNRNKDVPGFDTFWSTAENNAFGYADEDGVHYSASVAKILQDNYEELSQLDGFDDVDVDTYIEEALTGDEAAYIENQTNLMNATEILLGNNGLTAVDPAQYWRTRNGTADQHTSFTIAYNLCLAAASAGLDTDYSLVWNMGHGSNEGTSTGTFIEWVEEIVPTEAVSEGPVTVSIDAATYLDYSAGIEAGVYTWVASDDGSYYFLAATDEEGNPIYTESSRGGKTYQGVYTSTEITNTSYQTMLVYIPAAYLIIDEDGNVTGIDHDAVIGDYTADTAPIIYQNNCAGWNSSSPGSCSTDYIDEGMIYVSAGARSRNATDESGDYITGKSPTQVVDLKAGVIELRANTDIFPGNTDAIISVGTSGAGQMSSILGASGNMSEYYPYMYETGVLGVTYDAETDTYASEYADNIYAAQCYCPIADLENADLAYAWWWYDSAENGGDTYTEMGASEPGTLSEFKLRLQELEAWAYVDYINSLGLTDEDGNALTLTTPREGSYYDAILQNMSDALNALVEAGDIDPATEYEDSEDWLVQNEDGTWSVTDMAGFMSGTGLVNNRNKDVPGFDTFWSTAENNAFGYADEDGVHYSASVAKILQDNYEELSQLDGFDDVDVDTYIEEALTGDEAAYIENQTNLMNATEILLGNNGLTAVDPAQYWRTRNGTADQHTSFTIAYNLCLAAASAGLDTDYSLVWNMGHGSNEGTSTGTFVDWVKSITVSEEEEVSTDTLAVRRGVTFYFQDVLTDSATSNTVDYGRIGDEVFVGDWDGDGIDTLCVRRGNTFYFQNDLGSTIGMQVDYGRVDDVIVVGDWNGDGCDTLCARRGVTCYFQESWDSTIGNEVDYGRLNDVILSGDWDGDGVDTLCARRGISYYFQSSWDAIVGDQIDYGREADIVVVGDWTGDGCDTLAVRRGNEYYFQETLGDTIAFYQTTFGKDTDDVYAGTWK